MDASLKKILRSLSLELRHLLEGRYDEHGNPVAGDLEREMNRLGVWRDRPPKPLSELPHLKDNEREVRGIIDGYLTYRAEAGVSHEDAVAEFIRESAYSWANRLFALRCMEARGIIDPVILQEETYGGRSMVHNRFAQRNPSQCTGEDDGLFAMLSAEFRERSQELPDLFAPDSPSVALQPSVAALKQCIALLSGSVPANGGRATDEVFTAPDAFGWAYQYWNAEEKDRVFEMVRTKKGAKIEGANIIPATQLYTEPYMVKFLVQNSLGATWMMMHPESKLSAAWEYYVKDADRTPADKKPIAEITFLDPACGSGHFLIEAFDLLYAMYEEEGDLLAPAAICQSILNNNLFGIDIDERAVQITKAVLWMKAAEMVFTKIKQQLSGDGLSEFHDHIIATNIRLPKGKDHLDAFLKKHPEDAPLRPALLTVFEGLQNVHELGSLVQIEEPVEKELKVLKEQAKQQKFDPESGEIVERVNFPRWKQQVIKRLKAHFQEEAEKALPTEVFFSQSAVKGLALFDLLARRYDVVAANPPYMGSKNMGAWLKRYVEVHYHEGKRDLYAAFILRNFGLSQNGGRVAMVTQQSWMFLRSFNELRYSEEKFIDKPSKRRFNGLIKDTMLETLVHLGPRAFAEITGEVVNTVLFIFSNFPPSNEHTLTALRLIGPKSPNEKNRLLISTLSGNNTGVLSKPKVLAFRKIPNSPLCYWLDEQLLGRLTEKTLQGLVSVCQGVATADDERFIRYHWEVSHQNFIEGKIERRYFIFEKGGGFNKWYGHHYWLLDWEKDGIRIHTYPKSVVRNETFYFKSGLCYSRIANGNAGFRIFYDSMIFGCNGPALFVNNLKIQPVICSLLNTHFSTYILRSISQNLVFQVEHIERMPIQINIDETTQKLLEFIYDSCVEIKRNYIDENINEFFYTFEKNGSQQSLTKQYNIMINSQYRLLSFLPTFESVSEITFLKLFSLDLHKIYKHIFDETGTPVGFFPLISGYDAFPQYSDEFIELPQEIFCFFEQRERKKLASEELFELKRTLQNIFEAGYGSTIEVDVSDTSLSCNDSEVISVGARIPIPAETFLEELSHKMEIHPVSIYWLLKEGIEKEGWRCIPEEKRYNEDLFTVIVLRLLGHRWPKQIEAGEPVPEWADADGIIPITSGLTHPTLLQQVRDRIAAEFPNGKVHEIEREFEEVVGMSLERWLAGEFFKHHISQFKKRPVAWQLSSSPSSVAGGRGKGRGSRREPAFSCLVYYHKIDVDILHKIRTQYVGDLINRYGTELRTLEGRENLTGDQATRTVQLENWIIELNDFSRALQDVADTGFESPVLKEIVKNELLDEWTSRDGKVPHVKSVEEFQAQEKRYDPDINDGVRVNISPLQKAGLLAADVIAKKDVEIAISDRAEWRADERRWCREGKLPRPGWWWVE